MLRNLKRLCLSIAVLLPLLFMSSCGKDSTQPEKKNPEKDKTNKALEEAS